MTRIGHCDSVKFYLLIVVFHQVSRWYFCSIRTLISNRCAATRVTLPTNRRILNAFIEFSEMHFVENLLSGFREFKQWDYTDWDSDVTFLEVQGPYPR